MRFPCLLPAISLLAVVACVPEQSAHGSEPFDGGCITNAADGGVQCPPPDAGSMEPWWSPVDESAPCHELHCLTSEDCRGCFAVVVDRAPDCMKPGHPRGTYYTWCNALNRCSLQVCEGNCIDQPELCGGGSTDAGLPDLDAGPADAAHADGG